METETKAQPTEIKAIEVETQPTDKLTQIVCLLTQILDTASLPSVVALDKKGAKEVVEFALNELIGVTNVLSEVISGYTNALKEGKKNAN
jgi:hypothetical protein